MSRGRSLAGGWRFARAVVGLLVLGATLASPSRGTTAGESRGFHSGLLLPTADPITHSELGITLLSFPPSCVAEFASPVAGIVSTAAFAGYSWIPNGLGGVVSASARVQILRPTNRRWGATTLAQTILGAAIINAEGGGLNEVTAICGVVSSPLRPYRIHGGLALHTMPGSEYPGTRYDWRNPQVTPFVSLERRVRWGSVYAESIWAAPGADDGYDSVLLHQIGARIPRGNVSIRVSLGIGWDSFGSPARSVFPVPPLVSVSFGL